MGYSLSRDTTHKGRGCLLRSSQHTGTGAASRPRPNTRVTSRHLASGAYGRQISGSLVPMRHTPLAGMYAIPLMAATRDRALDIGSLGTGLFISCRAGSYA